jgi:hypothetical protein
VENSVMLSPRMHSRSSRILASVLLSPTSVSPQSSSANLGLSGERTADHAKYDYTSVCRSCRCTKANAEGASVIGTPGAHRQRDRSVHVQGLLRATRRHCQHRERDGDSLTEAAARNYTMSACRLAPVGGGAFLAASEIGREPRVPEFDYGRRDEAAYAVGFRGKR